MRTLRPLSSAAAAADDDAMAGAADTLRAMLRQEQVPQRRDYLHGDSKDREDDACCGDSSCSYASTATIPAAAITIDDACLATTPAVVVTEADRTAVVDWCYSIVDACDIDREVVASAMDMVDRFLSRETLDANNDVGDIHQSYLCDTRRYQLLVIAALYLSAKIHDSSIALSSAALAEACADLYTAVEIEAMERTILEGLEWRMHAVPTGVQLAYHILAVAMRHVQADDTDANNDAVDESTLLFLLDEVRFHAEYAVRSYHFSTRRPSTAALASIFSALEHLDDVQARYTMVRALLRALGEYDFACPSELVAAKDKLREVVERDSPEDGDGREATLSEPSSSARKYDGAAVADRFDDSKSPRTILNIIEY